jgi:hypothetical protein
MATTPAPTRKAWVRFLPPLSPTKGFRAWEQLALVILGVGKQDQTTT